MAACRRECSGVWVVVTVLSVLAGQATADKWEIVVQNAGVSAMHATLMSSNRVIFFDRTDFGLSNIIFPDGYCRKNPRDLKLTTDCSAHSMALDITNDKLQCLKVFSDPFCSTGVHLADGSLLQMGGWNDGATTTRTIGRGGRDDWVEHSNALAAGRWYSSNHILPDNRVIIVGGRREMSYEFHPRARNEGKFNFQFLRDTTTPGSENNLYPFVFLNTDGNLFIFANQDSILFDYKKNKVVRKYPQIADGPRNYPASAGAVLLPLTASDGYKKAEVMICGGAPANSFTNVAKGIFSVALQSCGRMEITAAAPKWNMVNMPMPRVMGDMLLLPTGECLIINGAGKGCAGWTSAKAPVLTPVTYDPARNRFFTQTASTIPRMYHSVALVLPDGKIYVAGGNANVGYAFKKVDFPTELRIEKYSPYYLDAQYDARRPKIVGMANMKVRYGSKFTVTFQISQNPQVIKFHLYAPPFTTHTFSSNQRMVVLKFDAVVGRSLTYSAPVYAPPSSIIAPAGYYLLTVVNQGSPSPSVWVQIST